MRTRLALLSSLLLGLGSLASVAATLSPRASFFETVMECREEQFRGHPERIAATFEDRDGVAYLKTASGKTWRAGRFRVLKLSELRKLTEGSLKADNHGTFSVVCTHQANGEALRRVDIGALQADPDNRKAVFQVSSNFNCLETSGPEDRASMERLDNYVLDLGQGPFASISAAPGLVLRQFYALRNQNNLGQPTEWAQVFDGPQVQLLADTDLPVRNGFLQFNAKFYQSKRHAAGDMAVGVLEGVQVTFGYRPNTESHEIVQDPEQVVHQVFTACLNLNRIPEAERAPVPEVARAMQLAAYEGTLRAALLLGSPKVVLTLLGGGGSSKPLDVTVAAITKQQDLITRGGLKVVLNLHHPRNGSHEPGLDQLVKKTGGSWTEY